MTIKLTNTLSGQKEEFKPIKKGRVGMYVCGPTVYDVPHIGHARSAYVFDVIRRYFEYRKLKVTFVRNVTDVDDKIIDKARQEAAGKGLNAAVKDVSAKYLDVYHDDMQALGIKPPTKEPKATAYINKMKKYIQKLIDNDVAYEADGDVYFDIRKAKDYGKLSNQSLDNLEAGARVSAGENKKDPLDFALWKKAKEGEPSWPSPWGKGRPGWHIECSAMSSDILGKEFDIHGGGIDLVFPHHENEIAQSEGAGDKFARYWIHNGLLTINSEKMAKSLGNFITIKDFGEKYNDNYDTLKLFFLSAHYSQSMDFTWDIIKEKGGALYGIIRFLKFVKQREEGKLPVGYRTDVKLSPEELKKKFEGYHEDFIKSMDDDFNTPQAIAVLFEMVRAGNTVLYGAYKKEYLPALKYASKAIIEFGKIFGLSFKEEPLSKPDKEIKLLVDARENFRKQKDFKNADRIRRELEEEGIILEDTKEGTTWRRKA